MVFTVVKTVGTTGVFSTPQLWEDGAPADLTTAEKSAAGTFAVAQFTQGEVVNFVGSAAVGKFLATDSTGVGTGTYIVYGVTSGNIAASDVATGATSGATCIISSSTPQDTGVIWKGEQQNQEFVNTVNDASLLYITGSTTSAAAYKEYTAGAGNSFQDHANVRTNGLRYNASNGAALKNTAAYGSVVRLDENYGRVNRLQLLLTTFGSYCFRSNNAFWTLKDCIVECTRMYCLLIDSNTNDWKLINCVFINDQATADGNLMQNGGLVLNCTFVRPSNHAAAGTMTVGNYSTQTWTNVAFFGYTTRQSGSSTRNFTYCATDLAAPTGTGNIGALTYANQFEQPSNASSVMDFRMKSGADLDNAGNTDATNAPNDISATVRAAGLDGDIGAWELVAAGGGKLKRKLIPQELWAA